MNGRSLYNSIKRRRDNLLGHILRHETMLKVILEGMTEGKGGRGRLRFHYFKQIMEDVGTQSYYKMKRLA